MKTNVLCAISQASRTMGELTVLCQHVQMDEKTKRLMEGIIGQLQVIIDELIKMTSEDFMTLECYRCASTHQLNYEEKKDPETGCVLDKYYVCVRCSDHIRITNECKRKNS